MKFPARVDNEVEPIKIVFLNSFVRKELANCALGLKHSTQLYIRAKVFHAHIWWSEKHGITKVNK